MRTTQKQKALNYIAALRNVWENPLMESHIQANPEMKVGRDKAVAEIKKLNDLVHLGDKQTIKSLANI